MATTIKHVTLKSLGKNKDIDPSKGTVTNPFTHEEYNNLCNTGEWTGGYVEAMGYVAPPMMDGMDDGSGSTQLRFLKIRSGAANSNEVEIDGFEEFSVYLKFSWNAGDAGTVTVTHPQHVPPSPIEITKNGKKYTYEINEKTFLFSTVDRVIPGSSEVEIGNNYFKVDFSFHYKKTVYDIATCEKTVYNNEISSKTYEVNITNYLYWEIR